MLDVRALVVFWEAVVDAVSVAAVPADVWNEFFCSAYCTALQDSLVPKGRKSLKIVPARCWF